VSLCIRPFRVQALSPGVAAEDGLIVDSAEIAGQVASRFEAMTALDGAMSRSADVRCSEGDCV
jgi:hypothetical protein